MTENPKNPTDAERQLDSLIDTMKDVRSFLQILVWQMWVTIGILIAIAIIVRIADGH